MELTLKTKFVEPTNTRGSRIQVSCLNGRFKGKRFYFPWDYSLTMSENHDDAAKKVVEKIREAMIAKYNFDLVPNEFAIGEDETGFLYVGIAGNKVSL